MRPTVACAIIAKNEARDLPKLLDSLAPVMDRIVVLDTGSSDDTMQIAAKYGAHVIYSELGKPLLNNFSEARNYALQAAEEQGCDWVCWMDADDVLATPQAFKRALYNEDCDVWGMWIQSGGYKWIHHRLMKTSKHLRFKGRCHEYLDMIDCRIGEIRDSLIVHNLDPDANQEDSNKRNLRILTIEWKEDGASPRTAFYLANTHKDAGRWKEAAEWYYARLAFGEGFRDEYLFALLYLARSHKALKEYPEALKVVAEGRAKVPEWAEFIMEQAYIEYEQKEYAKAIYTSGCAFDLPQTPTPLWRESSAYLDGPARLISWCHEHLGNPAQAIVWAQLARERIGGPDQQWDMRIARLKAGPPPLVRTKHDAIAICRPGAIGDILMTLNLIPALKAANPGVPIWYFCAPQYGAEDALGWLMREAGVDQVMDSNGWEQWSASCARAVNLVGYPLAEGYPEKPMVRHLIQYFASELRLLTPAHYAIAVQKPERSLAGVEYLASHHGESIAPGSPYATLQRRAGWSKYKQYARWDEVIERLPFPVVEISEGKGGTLQQAIAVFANAKIHLGIDSFCNHLTNYDWIEGNSWRKVPGVILWGSTQASAAGYPHNTNISRGLSCQPCFRENPAISRMPRGPCINPPRPTYEDPTPHACMDISVDEVVEAAIKLWETA